MTVLALDASTYAGTVAVLRDREVLAAVEVPMRGARVERLMPAVPTALELAGTGLDEVERVVCGAGPGSFTSLRIAASIAKGIALGRGAPLHATSSLLLLVAGMDELPPGGRYLAVLDALRGEAYAQLTTVDQRAGTVVAEGLPFLIPTSEVDDFTLAQGASIVGTGYGLDARPHARGVGRLGDPMRDAPAVSLASWEPDYGRLAEAQVRWETAHGRPLSGR